MIQAILHSLITFLDLTALACLIGIAWCLIWLGRPMDAVMPDSRILPGRLRGLLLAVLITLVVSSVGSLMQRSSEMGGTGLFAVLPLLPTVVLKTHYGTMWLVRIAGIAVAWVAWMKVRRLSGVLPFAVLLGVAGAAISFARSASGHPADYGDLSPQQIGDWLHLLAATTLAGTIIASAVLFEPSGVATDDRQQRSAAAVGGRLYFLFGPALAVLVFTGMYNAWYTVGSFSAMGATPYGGLLAAKIALLIFLAGRYIAPPAPGRDIALFSSAFLRRVRFEAVLVLGLLFCVAMLVHQIPARHYMHLIHQHDHEMHMHHMEDMPNMDEGMKP
ncbi:MAG: hypothetical protein M0024_05850 [Nitrospiraceae bacterium]|nr:hypothetical protein [Nitrospiraceae bacterium]